MHTSMCYTFRMSNITCNITNYDIAIIGGGASGLMLAANLYLNGRSGIILEGSSIVGSKLLMSGGGRCNITHGGSVKDFVRAYGDEGPLLRKCLNRHSNLELCNWLESHGVALTEADSRIFPASMKSRDVLDAFLNEAKRNQWQIKTNAKVSGLEQIDMHSNSPESDKSSLWEIKLQDCRPVTARNLVIATGGITYPETGSDGSMFEIIRGLGIKVSELRPALAQIFVKDYPYSELSGISLADVTVTAYGSASACTCNGKSARMNGDLLFTHEGLSGPVILNISKYAECGETIRLCYNKELSDLPKRMQNLLKERSKGSSGDIKTTVLASLLDHDDFTVSDIDSRGMVTSGGVTLSEIDLSTMQIKRFVNEKAHAQCTGSVYAIGEAIDADGITGGYNLQLCWSTATTAAESLKAAILES